ncbi:hypothetical protein M0812_13679 [Anaeramoeba flamelloides]|uniref:Uncharacterized protein n=1 Tax=Anaeramoeba flamelloides TaxID=1746091 RepID=A0AAV7ZKS3_9EUKA|nr:hypothetical protein M0812_13679 [Anaeramoeba flamelloides]
MTFMFVVFVLSTIVSANSFDLVQSNKKFLLAAYLPWFKVSDLQTYECNHWEWCGGYASVYTPLLGVYDNVNEDSDRTRRAHLMQMRASGVNGVIVNWFGEKDPNGNPRYENQGTHLLVENLPQEMGFAIMLDAENYRDAVNTNTSVRKERFLNDVRYLKSQFFEHPNYLKMDGKPILEYFRKPLSETLDNRTVPFEWWQQISDEVDFAFVEQIVDKEKEPNFFKFSKALFGWPEPTHDDPQDYGYYVIKHVLDNTLDWKETNDPDLSQNFTVITGIWPGFDDTGVIGWTCDHNSVRKINREVGNQQVLSKTYQQIKEYNQNVKSKFPNNYHKYIINTLQIATFNDWNEGSQIEASKEYGINDIINTATIAQDFGVEFTHLDTQHYDSLKKYLSILNPNNDHCLELSETQKIELENLFFAEKYDEFTLNIDRYFNDQVSETPFFKPFHSFLLILFFSIFVLMGFF